MSAAVKLLEDCTSRGIRLRPGKEGMLKVSPPPEKLSAELREELRRHKPELLQLLTAAEFSLVWPCPHCGQEAAIDDVFPSQDGERTLTMWRCDPCQVVAVTPDGVRQPPSGWVKASPQERH